MCVRFLTFEDHVTHKTFFQQDSYSCAFVFRSLFRISLDNFGCPVTILGKGVLIAVQKRRAVEIFLRTIGTALCQTVTMGAGL